MNIRQLKKEIKQRDGGILKFKDRYRAKTYYFEMDGQTGKEIVRHVQKKRDFILLLEANGHHRIYSSMESLIKEKKDFSNAKVGSIVALDSTYAIANKEITMNLLNHMTNPPMEETLLDTGFELFIEQGTACDSTCPAPVEKKVSTSKKNSLFTVSKKSKKRPFDWHEAFLEGMRIFGNVEEAEGYADDEERKHK